MNLNDTLIDFTLPGTDRQQHSIKEYDEKDAIVILFTCNHCPYARAYVDRINKLVIEYEPQNIGFYAINSNDAVKYPADSFDNMIPMGEALNLHGKYLYDESQEIAHAFDAQRTPEAFVFNRKKQLVYHGAIDDSYEDASAVRQNYLKDALDAVLDGKEVPTKETQAVGCTIKWK